MNIKGKTALITGGARRIGRVIAEALAERGANLIIHYNRSQKDAIRAQKELSRSGVSITLFQADFTKVKTLEKKTRRLLAEHGPIHILINNASSFYPTPFGKISECEWDDLVNSNLKGPFFLTQRIGKAMLKAGAGKIVNVGDAALSRPYMNYIPYGIAKTGVIALTQMLAKNLAPKVQVNCVSPGSVLLPEKPSNRTKRPAGSPRDIAQAVLFFLEGTDHATGVNLIVDGGQAIK